MIDKDTKIKIEGVPKDYVIKCHNGNSKTEWKPKDVNFCNECLIFKLDNPIIGLKAEFIDNDWYWVCGCPICLGIERKHYRNDYHICDDHDVCESCGVKRNEIKATVYGTRNGWNCKKCNDRLDRDLKIKVLSEFDVDDEDYDIWDFERNDNILCPHCNSEIESTDNYNSSDNEECPFCGGFYELQVDYNPSYTTKVKGERLRLKDIIGEEK